MAPKTKIIHFPSVCVRCVRICGCVCVCVRCVRICVCVCVTCFHVFWNVCLKKQVKRSNPLRNSCLLLVVCVCVWVCACACGWMNEWRVVCMSKWMSYSWRTLRDLTYVSSRTVLDTRGSFHTELQNVAWMKEKSRFINVSNLVVFPHLQWSSISSWVLFGVSGKNERKRGCVINLTLNVNKNMIDWAQGSFLFFGD